MVQHPLIAEHVNSPNISHIVTKPVFRALIRSDTDRNVQRLNMAYVLDLVEIESKGVVFNYLKQWRWSAAWLPKKRCHSAEQWFIPGEMMTMVDHGHHGFWWSTMVVHGRPSNTMVKSIYEPWSTTVTHGRPLPKCMTMANHGRPWSNSYKVSATKIDHGHTMGDHGHTMVEHGQFKRTKTWVGIVSLE